MEHNEYRKLLDFARRSMNDRDERSLDAFDRAVSSYRESIELRLKRIKELQHRASLSLSEKEGELLVEDAAV